MMCSPPPAFQRLLLPVMARVMRPGPAPAAERRWVTWVTWIAILAPIPYSLSRVLWAAGIPVGITEEFLSDLDSPGWGSLGLLFLALLSEGTGVFTHIFVKARAPRGPTWMPFFRELSVRPWMVIGPLLMPIAALAWINLDSLSEIFNGELEQPSSAAGQPSWSLWGHLIIFWVWGLSLTVATFAYHSNTHPALAGQGPQP